MKAGEPRGRLDEPKMQFFFSEGQWSFMVVTIPSGFETSLVFWIFFANLRQVPAKASSAVSSCFIPIWVQRKSGRGHGSGGPCFESVSRKLASWFSNSTCHPFDAKKMHNKNLNKYMKHFKREVSFPYMFFFFFFFFFFSFLMLLTFIQPAAVLPRLHMSWPDVAATLWSPGDVYAGLVEDQLNQRLVAGFSMEVFRSSAWKLYMRAPLHSKAFTKSNQTYSTFRAKFHG